MEADELLSLMTLGAVAPYALEGLLHWAGRAMKPVFGAIAPTWIRLQGSFTRSA